MSHLSEADTALIASIQKARENDPLAGLRIAREAIDALGDRKGSHFHAELQLQIGNCFTALTQHAEAIDALSDSIRLYDNVTDRIGAARAWCGLGAVYRNLSLMMRACQMMAKGRQLFEDAGAGFELACTLQNMGVVANEMGRLDDALRYTEEAARFPDQRGIALSLFCMNDMVVIRTARANSPALWDEIDRHAELLLALEAGNAAIRKASSGNQKRILGSLCASVAEAQLELGRMDEAEPNLALAFELAAQLNNLRLTIRVLRVRGAMALRRGQLDAAVEWLEHAMRLVDNDRLYRELMAVSLLLADAHAAQGKHTESMRLLRRYRAISADLRSREEIDAGMQ